MEDRRRPDPTNAWDALSSVGKSLIAAAQIVLIAWISYKVAPLPACMPIAQNPPLNSN
jgi:hypothetical protein